MRHDAFGLFWEDVERTGKRGSVARVMPPIPETGWRPPTEFPDLRGASCICVDVETYDPNLITRGPGWARNDGHIVGVAIGVPDGRRWYFPVAHEVEPEFNLDKEKVFSWLKWALGFEHQTKVGANILYDYGWLYQEGIEIKGQLIDVQYAEALLEEDLPVGLDFLGERYLGEGKEGDVLYDWCASYYGGNPTHKQRANIYRAPARLVGPYAEGDVDLPLRVAACQYPRLVETGLLSLFEMECRLIKLCFKMRWQGVRVDLEKTQQLYDDLQARIINANNELNYIAGCDLNTGSSQQMAVVFDRLGIPYTKTAKGNPSFTKNFLEELDHPIGEKIREIRKYEKLSGTFLKSYILDSHVNGIVYGQFHALRGDVNGTRSGRFASSTPNLQNIPSRDDELAPLIRGLFIPFEEHRYWRKYDYSQIEYRFLVHYAVGRGADEARALFNADPDTDYHDFVQGMVAPVAGWDVSTEALWKHWRKPLKTINFGLIYGMQKPKLIKTLHLGQKEGDSLFKAYHEAIPYADATMKAAAEEVDHTGCIRTILNRRSPFDMWEKAQRGRGEQRAPALPYDKAYSLYGPNIQRAYRHKALNRKLQGSAADMMKKAMLVAMDSGVFDETGIPVLTVHDELDFSDPGNKHSAFDELKNIMETCLPLRIPVKADCDIGPNWGHVEDYKKWVEKQRK